MSDSVTGNPVKYVNKDFSSYKRDLIRYAQAHFSGAYQDFNEVSPGMMLLEMQAYIADNLSFYMDQQFLELKQATAREPKNIEDFAKMRGYKPKPKRAARVTLSFFISVPVSPGTTLPNNDYCPIIRAGASVNSEAGILFQTIEDCDMSIDPREVRPAAFDNNGNVTYVAVRKNVSAIAAETQVDTIEIGDYEQFKRVKLGRSDVQEILSVVDSENNHWYEVDYLAQNAVFDSSANTDSDSTVVPYVLKMRTCPRRFCTDFSNADGTFFLQFGAGDSSKFSDELVPNAAAAMLPLTGKSTFYNYTLDPQNFLQTRSLGISPYNTILTVTYLAGGGLNSNVPARTINRVNSVTLMFRKNVGDGGLNPAVVSDIRSSIEVINDVQSEGGYDAESPTEIKVNASSFFAAQARIVTKEDFATHILSIPPKFGSPARVLVNENEYNPTGVNVHILSLDADGHFQKPTQTLMTNISTYIRKLRMLTEGVTLLGADIINLGIDFGVVISPHYNRQEVLTQCLLDMRDYFNINKMQIGSPVVKSDVIAVLQSIKGVISVYRLDISRKSGAGYSNDSYNVAQNTVNGIIYCPKNAIFEVKFPLADIKGESR